MRRHRTDAMDAALRTIDDAVLRVTGPDARAWLGGQVTNEVRGLAPGAAVYTLILTNRGKILSDAWVLERGQDLLLLVPRAVSSAIAAHLDDHIVMEDVLLEPTDDVVLTVQGHRARELVTKAGLASFPCDRLGEGGADVIVAPDDAAKARAALVAAGAEEIDEPSWERERVRRGRPRFGVDFGDQHYPQEAGLKALAVSFEKGCYLGQEVVCMLESRGQLTRRLVQLRGDASPGDELTHEGAKVGSVTSAEDGLALGYVKRAVAVAGGRVNGPRGELDIIAIVGESSSGLAEGRAL